jgi:hypothetical protein
MKMLVFIEKRTSLQHCSIRCCRLRVLWHRSQVLAIYIFDLNESKDLGVYSQHFIFFVTYESAQ